MALVSEQGVHSLNSPLLAHYKLIISHVQVMGVIATINADWDYTSGNIMFFLEFLAKLPLEAVAPICLIDSFNYSLDEASERRVFYFRLIALIITPLVVLLGLCLIAVARYLCYTRYYFERERYDGFFMTVAFVFMPQIMSFTFEAFNCSPLL